MSFIVHKQSLFCLFCCLTFLPFHVLFLWNSVTPFFCDVLGFVVVMVVRLSKCCTWMLKARCWVGSSAHKNRLSGESERCGYGWGGGGRSLGCWSVLSIDWSIDTFKMQALTRCSPGRSLGSFPVQLLAVATWALSHTPLVVERWWTWSWTLLELEVTHHWG